MVRNNDNEWRWDETQAVYFDGDDAQREANAILMEAAGVDDPKAAVDVLRGRPRVGEEPREETVRLQVVVPKSWQEDLDRSANEEHLTRSAFLRKLIGLGRASASA